MRRDLVCSILVASWGDLLDQEAHSLASSVNPANEELLDVMARTMTRLNLTWSRKRQDVAHSRLDERFLESFVRPSSMSLLFLLDLHTEVERS